MIAGDAIDAGLGEPLPPENVAAADNQGHFDTHVGNIGNLMRNARHHVRFDTEIHVPHERFAA